MCIYLPHMLLPFRLRSGDVDVEREFYQSPRTWLDRRYPDSHTSVPTHLVMYDILVKVGNIIYIFELYNNFVIFTRCVGCPIFLETPQLSRGMNIVMFAL